LLWLAGRFERQGHPRAAAVAAWLASGVLVAALVNALQKTVLYLEVHGHIAQPLPALAAVCGAIAITLAISAALFAIAGMIAVRRSRPTTAQVGHTR
jgi:hypothetical protein